MTERFQYEWKGRKQRKSVVVVIYSITSSIAVYNYTGQDISQNSVRFRIVRYFIVKLAVPILTQNMRGIFLCIFYWQGCVTPYRQDPWFRSSLMHAVLQQSCSVQSFPTPPAAGHCFVLRVLQTEGMGRVELVLNSNIYTDTCHTFQLCSLDTAMLASRYRGNLSALLGCTQRLVSVNQLTGGGTAPQRHLVASCG